MLAAHQREGVRRARAVLNRRRGVILADDVGLGKSFVAAEVMRGYSQVELVVPAALLGQWRETLGRFQLEATLLTHDSLDARPFYPEPRERLLVVDEAHAFRNPRTRRYAALARRTVGARVLLVTATPVCNALEDLEALIRLIGRDDLLADLGVPSIDVAFASRDAEQVAVIAGELLIRRDRKVLPAELRFGELERQVVRHRVPDLPALDTLQFPLVGGGAVSVPMLRRFLWRRLESSEAALEESLRRQLRFYERSLSALAAGRTLPKRDYRRSFAHEEDREAFQEILFWDLFAPAGGTDPQVIRAEMARIERVREAVRRSPCSKRTTLLKLLDSTREPALLFTGSVATARDLYAALRERSRAGLVTSRERSREAVLQAFRRGLLDVVVSTDMAAEGLNLQRAGLVVHYDIPWNPVKLDQRNGRAWRIGQERPAVRAVYFLPDSRRTGIVGTVARKNRIRRTALEGSHALPTSALRTVRPRLAHDAAVRQLRGVELTELLARRHKAGVEALIRAVSHEYQDAARLEELFALVAWEMRGT